MGVSKKKKSLQGTGGKFESLERANPFFKLRHLRVVDEATSPAEAFRSKWTRGLIHYGKSGFEKRPANTVIFPLIFNCAD